LEKAGGTTVKYTTTVVGQSGVTVYLQDGQIILDDILTLYSVMVLPALRIVCVALWDFTSNCATHIEPDLSLFSS